MGERVGTITCAKLCPTGHQSGDKPVEVRSERKLQPVLDLAVFFLTQCIDGKGKPGKTLDLRGLFQATRERQSLIELTLGDKPEKQALLDGLVGGVECV